MTDFSPEKIYHALIQAGNDWADKEAAASLLEETRRSVLAEFINQAQGSSVAACEAQALANPAYRLHLANMVTARKEANRARCQYDAQKTLTELRRTEQSNLRAEMKLV